MAKPLPEIGSWYRGPDGNTFEVVAVDEKDQTIEVQHYDGTLEEFDLETWEELELTATEQPEDWSGPMDVEEEDGPEDDESREEWDDPLDFVDEQD